MTLGPAGPPSNRVESRRHGLFTVSLVLFVVLCGLAHVPASAQDFPERDELDPGGGTNFDTIGSPQCQLTSDPYISVQLDHETLQTSEDDEQYSGRIWIVPNIHGGDNVDIRVVTSRPDEALLSLDGSTWTSSVQLRTSVAGINPLDETTWHTVYVKGVNDEAIDGDQRFEIRVEFLTNTSWYVCGGFQSIEGINGDDEVPPPQSYWGWLVDAFTDKAGLVGRTLVFLACRNLPCIPTGQNVDAVVSVPDASGVLLSADNGTTWSSSATLRIAGNNMTNYFLSDALLVLGSGGGELTGDIRVPLEARIADGGPFGGSVFTSSITVKDVSEVNACVGRDDNGDGVVDAGTSVRDALRALARTAELTEFRAVAGENFPIHEYQQPSSPFSGLTNHFEGVARLRRASYIAWSGTSPGASNVFFGRTDSHRLEVGPWHSGPTLPNPADRVINYGSQVIDRSAKHSGGMSAFGDFLAIPLENAGRRESSVVFLDASDPEHPVYLPLRLVRANSPHAGAVAVTKLDDGRFLVAIQSDAQPTGIVFYVSTGTHIRTNDAFQYIGTTHWGSWGSAALDVFYSAPQSLTFLRECVSRNLYLLATARYTGVLQGQQGPDLGVLYAVTPPAYEGTNEPSLEYVDHVQFYCTGEACNFAAAAGAYVDPGAHDLILYSTPKYLVPFLFVQDSIRLAEFSREQQ